MPELVRLREITQHNEQLLRPAYALLRRIFPRHELVPLDEMRNALRETQAGVLADLRWHMLVAEQHGKVVGAASGNYFGSLNVGIVGYLAVDPAVRAHGLGPRLRRRLRAAFETDARRIRKSQLAALVGEVEEDNPWLETLVRRRGALILDFPYVQPGLRADEPTVPLALYYEPLDRPRRRIPAALARKLVFALWRRGYRVARPLSDARFRAMLRSLEGRQQVGSRPIGRSRARPSVRE